MGIDVLVELGLGEDLLLDVVGVDGVAHRPHGPEPEPDGDRRDDQPGQHRGQLGQLHHEERDGAGGGDGEQPGHHHLADDLPAGRPARRPHPLRRSSVAAAWVVEIGMPRPVAPKMAVVAPMLAATPELACSVVMRSPIVSMMLPAAPQGADRDGGVGGERDPVGHQDVLAVVGHRGVAGGEQQRGDDAHRLLGVVGAVAERDGAGRHQLQALEDRVLVAHAEEPLQAADDEHREEGDA